MTRGGSLLGADDVTPQLGTHWTAEARPHVVLGRHARGFITYVYHNMSRLTCCGSRRHHSSMTESEGALVDELVAAGRALSVAGLVTAFGHVSARASGNRLLITPPVPLGSLAPSMPFIYLDVEAPQLPASAPREAWIHLSIARGRPEIGAVCRAQPPVATALASAGVPIVPLHGQGSYLGERVPVFDDAILVRDERRGTEVANSLGQSPAVVLRGNGAVTVGATIGEAVALMWVLEASARMNSIAAAAGTPSALSQEEQSAWRATAPEIVGRIWAHLRKLEQGIGPSAGTTSPPTSDGTFGQAH
jgi:HCOMODA/2-hydroxy-3-carboxy-muconic semialdehyde decarboxylase